MTWYLLKSKNSMQHVLSVQSFFPWVHKEYHIQTQHERVKIIAGGRIFWCHPYLISEHVILSKAIYLSGPQSAMWIPMYFSTLEFCEIRSADLSPSPELQGPVQFLLFFQSEQVDKITLPLEIIWIILNIISHCQVICLNNLKS